MSYVYKKNLRNIRLGVIMIMMMMMMNNSPNILNDNLTRYVWRSLSQPPPTPHHNKTFDFWDKR